MPENSDVVGLFLACATQWQHSEGQPVGLRYESALAVMDVYGVEDKRGMLNRLNIMERAALVVIQSRK